MKFVSLREARHDQRVATEWYRKESKELVRRFLDERRAVLKRIKASPQQFPIVETVRRQALMVDFPYKIIFEASADFILIVAFAHTSRDNYWVGRSE
jgi:hypothetical protein